MAPLLRSGPNYNAFLTGLTGTVRCKGNADTFVGVVAITVRRILGGHWMASRRYGCKGDASVKMPTKRIGSVHSYTRGAMGKSLTWNLLSDEPVGAVHS